MPLILFSTILLLILRIQRELRKSSKSLFLTLGILLSGFLLCPIFQIRDFLLVIFRIYFRNARKICSMRVLTAGMIKPCCYCRRHKRIFAIFTAATAPHIIYQDLTHERQALRARRPSLVHNHKMHSPLLPHFAFSLQVSSLACCPNCHICIVSNRMSCSIGILNAIQTCRKKILCRHIYRFLIGTSSGISVYLRVIYDLSVLIICHA